MSFPTGEQLLDFCQRIGAHALTTVLRRSFHSVGRNTVVQGPVRLVGASQISIGDGCFVGRNCWIEACKDPDASEPLLRIGNRVSISGDANISASGSVVIGDSVLIGRYVFISDHSHVFAQDRPIRDQGSTPAECVYIGDGTWIGQGALILPGSFIGRNCVIGAGAVVKGVIPDRSIVSGRTGVHRPID